MSERSVPLLDLQSQYQALREETLKAIDETLASGQWVLGPRVQAFEEEIGRMVGAKHAIGVASGTDALLLSLKALGCGPGDEVISPAFSFFATAGAIANCGATPVFVDIDPKSFNIDVRSLEAAITDRTKAVIPVHLFGQSAEMDAILKLCGSRKIGVIEDAAQSIGSTYKERRIGSIGDTACFSFYPTKNLGGAGDGGMITTNDDQLAETLRVIRVHGAKPKYYNRVVGFNSRLDALQAAILSVKVAHLDGWAEGRRRNAAGYDRGFAGVAGIETPPVVVEGRHVYNQYTIRVTRGSRDALVAHLKERRIGSEIYYPYPLHLLPAFSSLGYREGSLPVCEQACQEVLSLPIFPEMTTDQQGYVVETVTAWAKAQ